MRATNLPADFSARGLTYAHHDDFDSIVTGEHTTGGTVAIADAVNGVVTLTTGDTANSEAFLTLAKKTLKLDRPSVFQASVRFTDANGMSGAVAVGISDKAAAGLIVNGGLSLVATHFACLFVKFTGADYLSCVTISGASGAIVHRTDLTNENIENQARRKVGLGGSFTKLEIEVLDTQGEKEVLFAVNGEIVAKHNALNFDNATLLSPVLLTKTTSAHAQVLSADYWQFAQKR